MTVKKRWRLEVNDPRKSNDWSPLWQFDEDQCATYQELADDLNKINAPIQVRLAPVAD
jgi:hypothetical protein